MSTKRWIKYHNGFSIFHTNNTQIQIMGRSSSHPWPKTYATNWALSMTAPSGPFNEHMVDAITIQSTRSENVWTTVAWSISGEEGKLLDATITTKIHPGNI